jgi:diphosphomevalonate decarboxylase
VGDCALQSLRMCAESDGSLAVSRCATAVANANIALIKYWGKADERLIIPRASSLSLTLDGLSTSTTVQFGASDADSLTIDGTTQQGTALNRVSAFLDIIREKADINLPARVTSANTVPYGAGLASSASAFAALAGAACKAAGLDATPRELSRLARRGSGSACRSIFGGLVKWNAGHDDESSYAEPVDSADMDLAVLVILISGEKKPIPSREAMRRTVVTSPLYDAWIDSCQDDLDAALAAIHQGDVERLGELTEANSFGMHASMMASRPAVLYWLPETVAALNAVTSIRDGGLGAWSTMDAGPNVKVLTDGRDAERVADELRNRLPDCEVQIHRPGGGLHFVQ